MPEISADGRIWRIRLKPGISFSDDAVFKGAKRELTAQDYVYSWKRLLDPRIRSPNVEILGDRLTGARAAMDKAKQAGRFDYDAEIEGLRAIDRYTIELKLTEPDYTLLPYLTGSALAAVAREVIETYGDSSGRAMDHPVGTGAYRLGEWRRGQRIVLEAHTGYRAEYFPTPPAGADAATIALGKSMAGRRLPQIGRIELSIIEAPQPLLPAFDSGALDLLELPFELALKAVDVSGRLLPRYGSQGVTLQRITDLYLGYLMDDPLVGGYTPESGLRCGARSSWPTTLETKSASCVMGKGFPQRSQFRRTSMAMCRGSTCVRRTTPRQGGRCWTSSVIAIATAMACANCRMVAPSYCRWARRGPGA